MRKHILCMSDLSDVENLLLLFFMVHIIWGSPVSKNRENVHKDCKMTNYTVQSLKIALDT